MADDAERIIRTAHAYLSGALATGPAAALERAVRLADASMAVHEAARAIDPERRLGPWALAGALEAELDDFEHGPYRLIAAGRRGAKNALEDALARILACPRFPRSQRRLFALLN